MKQMGTWNVSINGNDTAQDLKSEYQAAFFYNDVDIALKKIDAYVRSMFDETDEEEWCNYYYSLADYMWKHGILTDTIRNRVITMIDTGFGLGLWEEAGIKTLKKRKKALAEFREKLLSQQPTKKKIRIDLHMTPIFEVGDLIAIQLNTFDKHYLDKSKFTEETFRSCDGKYVVLRKVCDDISYTSCVEPNVRDIWIRFQLYKKVFDSIPTMDQLEQIPWANTENTNGSFICESSMFYFKKRNYTVIGK
ncbi:MAG: hypothetical protein IJN22_04520, partial [Clostridia bacterium]|nr:hypothetical protein [Clostridia bacterium]